MALVLVAKDTSPKPWQGKTVLVTGVAGFIGMHCAEKLLSQGAKVIGIDNFDPYYDVGLKQARIERLESESEFNFELIDIAMRGELNDLFAGIKPSHVLHLAAQVGVRNSIDHPQGYTDSNLLGFGNILQACRVQNVKHLVFASSSSVYGGNTRLPFAERDAVDHPISYYAATKKATELMAHSYAHLFRLPCTGLRFFTAYGPWGRPDMAYFKFTRSILEGRPIEVYDFGHPIRDYTYIDDIVECVLRVLAKPAAPDPKFDPSAPSAGVSQAPWRIFNVGGGSPVGLLKFIEALESALGQTAIKRFLPAQMGDMNATSADTSALTEWIGFVPATQLSEGTKRFASWYLKFYTGV
jgi:UDP-glucuronate 4-epimerase